MAPPPSAIFAPLIHGQAMPPYRRDGMPAYVALKNTAVPRLLADWRE